MFDEYFEGCINGCAVIIVIIVALLLAFPMFFFRYSTTREATHTGYVTAVEKNEFLGNNNYLIYFKTDASSSQEDKYCVQERNRSLVEVLKEKQKKKELVTVTYVGVTGIGRDLCEQDEIVKVEENK